MMKLEAGISEIASMFADLAMLVEQQGEMLNRIEDHVNSEPVNMLMLMLVTMVKCRFTCYGTRSSRGLCCFQLFLLLHVST